jgi:hypothetical protein
LFKVLLLTVPPVALYFVGWAYLHFYLRAFGIGLSELDLDVQTIFIYSFPVIRALIDAHMAWITVFALALVLAVLFALILPRAWIEAAERRARLAAPWILALVVFIAIPVAAAWSIPGIRSTAHGAADRKWTSEGVAMDAALHRGDAAGKVRWERNYRECASRRALDLIFSDKAAYYLLCASTVDKRSALVFEVRREGGLSSVRFVTREP